MIRTRRSFLAATTLTILLAACSSASEDGGSVSSGSAASENTFDRDNVMEDDVMQDVDAAGAAEIQAFLERTPYGMRSVLADYRPKGKPVSQILVDTGREYGINPLVLLARLQIEQGLVSKSSAPEEELERAFGCGCADGRSCSSRYLGFENQARCGAAVLQRSLERLRGPERETVSGWAKGASKQTLDGLSVTPANDATAALYTYTPWVGQLGGGRATVGGTSGFWKVFVAFEEALRGGSETSRASELDDGRDDEGATEECSERGCDEGQVCGAEGTCVPGCRVTGGVDSCGAGQRCSRTDGLVGTCEAEACACTAGMFCDESTGEPRCVQCTAQDTTNCLAEAEGDACLPSGRCGCRTSADCGYDRKRICDPFRGVCMPDPFGGSQGDEEPVDGGDGGAPSAPVEEDPGVEPAPVPELPPAPPRSSGSPRRATGDDDRGAEAEMVDVPGPSTSSSGRTVARPTNGPALGAPSLALGLVVFALRRRRRESSQ